MVSSLPTGNALPSLFHRLLMFFKCIIWIALASIAQVPVVVGVFLSLGNLVLTSSGLPNTQSEWCVCNSHVEGLS
jgi:hypothetical protein